MSITNEPATSMRRAEGRPRVFIGMPAYNSAAYVGQALLSLLAQDYGNLKILVADDGSADDTATICDEIAALDGRVHVVRNRHLGARATFNFLLSRADGEYFMWAADHDTWAPTYVSTCVDALEGDPRAVLAYAHTMLVGEDGKTLESVSDELDVGQPDAFSRYCALIWRLDACSAIFGVARAEAMANTGGYGPTIGPDHLVLAKLALAGTIIQSPLVLYTRRQNRPPETPVEMQMRQAADLLPEEAAYLQSQPRDAQYRPLRDGHIRAVWASSMSPTRKLLATFVTLRCFRDRFGVRSFPIDAMAAMRPLVPSRVRRLFVWR